MRDDDSDGSPTDPELAAAYRAAHEDYLARARRRSATCPRSTASRAGGMPDRVKCLHVLVGARAGRRARASTRSATRRWPLLPDWWAAGPCVAVGGDGVTPGRGDRLRHQLDPAAGRRRRRGGRHAARPRPADGDRPARPGRRPHRAARRRRRWSGPSPRCEDYADAIARARRRPGAVRRDLGARATPRTATSSSPASATRLGVEPEVVTGDEEARLSFAGATRELAAAGHAGAASSSSTSAAARPSSCSARRGRAAPRVGRRRLRAADRAAPARRPADRRPRSRRPAPTSTAADRPRRRDGAARRGRARSSALAGIGDDGGGAARWACRRTTRSASTRRGSPPPTVARGRRRAAGA